MEHVCVQQKKANAGTIWQCSCGQHYKDGSAVASFIARELMAEQELEQQQAKLNTRAILLKNGGYSKNNEFARSNNGSFPYDKILGFGIHLLECEAFRYWEHPSGKSYLLTLVATEAGPFQIVSNWCKQPMLPKGMLLLDNPRPMEGQKAGGHKIAAKLLDFEDRSAKSRYNARAYWQDIVKKRREHGYNLVRGTDMFPEFLISGKNTHHFAPSK